MKCICNAKACTHCRPSLNGGWYVPVHKVTGEVLPGYFCEWGISMLAPPPGTRYEPDPARNLRMIAESVRPCPGSESGYTHTDRTEQSRPGETRTAFARRLPKLPLGELWAIY